MHNIPSNIAKMLATPQELLCRGLAGVACSCNFCRNSELPWKFISYFWAFWTLADFGRLFASSSIIWLAAAGLAIPIPEAISVKSTASSQTSAQTLQDTLCAESFRHFIHRQQQQPTKRHARQETLLLNKYPQNLNPQKWCMFFKFREYEIREHFVLQILGALQVIWDFCRGGDATACRSCSSKILC